MRQGDIVLFTSVNGDTSPAIVTRTYGELRPEGTVDLTVFPANNAPYWIPEAKWGEGRNTWSNR